MLNRNNKKSKKRSSKKASRLFFLRWSGKKKFIVFLFVALFASVGAAFIMRSSAAAGDDGAAMDQMTRVEDWRTVHGKPTLWASKCMSQAAQDWANRNADVMRNDHSNVGGLVASRCGSHWRYVGENVGFDQQVSFPGNPTPNLAQSARIFDGFTKSSVHNTNMLGNNYPWNKFGVGAAKDIYGRMYVVQLFAVASGGAYEAPYEFWHGNLETANCTAIKGWLLNRANYNNQNNIHVYFYENSAPNGWPDGPYVWPTDRQRDDVNRIWLASGKHGYYMPIPQKWKNKRSFTVRVFGFWKGTSKEIAGKTLLNCKSIN